MPGRFPPGPHRRRGSLLAGGTPLALPLVVTLPAGAVTATSASLNGSVNPQGSATNWWFAWGTSTSYGHVTGTVAAGSGSMPLTVNTPLTGLTTGTTYHFAIVAQSAAGTVFGTDQSFVAQTASVVTDASRPLIPVGAPRVAIPHFEFPFTMTVQGAEVAEQDSLDEVFACVQTIANCPVGSCPELPTFGLPDLVFSQAPLDPTGVVQAVKRWEPRAEETAIVQAVDDAGDQWQLQLTTGTIGTGSST